MRLARQLLELRLGERRAGQLQDLVGLAQLAVFALQFRNALRLAGGGAWAPAVGTLGLAHSAPQCLGRAADVDRDGLDACLLRLVRSLAVRVPEERLRVPLRQWGNLRTAAVPEQPHRGSALALIAKTG